MKFFSRFSGILQSIFRFPLPSLGILFAVLFFIGFNHGMYEFYEKKFIIIFQGVLFLFFSGICTHLLIERIQPPNYIKIISILITLGFTTAYIFLLPLEINSLWDGIILLSHVVFLAVGSVLLPTWGKDDSSFKNSISNSVLGILVASVYFWAVFLSGGLFLFALDTLFNIKIDWDFTIDMILILAGICSFIFLSHLPEGKYIQKKNEKEDKIISLFKKYFLLPFSSLFGILLNIYLLKILIFQDWPEGNVTWFILVFSAISWASLFLFNNNQITSKSLQWWNKGIIISLFLQSIMIFLSLQLRISQYGLTAPRVIIAVLGLALLISSVLFFFKRDIKYPFLLFAVFLFLGTTSPWNAQTIAIENQISRFYETIENNNMRTSDGGIRTLSETEKQNFSEEDAIKIISSVKYLQRTNTQKADVFLETLPQNFPNGINLPTIKSRYSYSPSTYFYLSQDYGKKTDISEYQFTQEKIISESNKIEIEMQSGQVKKISLEAYCNTQQENTDNSISKPFIYQDDEINLIYNTTSIEGREKKCTDFRGVVFWAEE